MTKIENNNETFSLLFHFYFHSVFCETHDKRFFVSLLGTLKLFHVSDLFSIFDGACTYSQRFICCGVIEIFIPN